LTFRPAGSKILINIGQIRIGKDHIRFKAVSMQQGATPRASVGIGINLFYVELKMNSTPAWRARFVRVSITLEHAALGIPHAMRQLRVRHKRKSSRALQTGSSHVNILNVKADFKRGSSK